MKFFDRKKNRGPANKNSLVDLFFLVYILMSHEEAFWTGFTFLSGLKTVDAVFSVYCFPAYTV